jgi:hypothetical protein
MRRLTGLCTLALLIVGVSTSPASAQRVWYEYGVASATSGYDSSANQTLINKFDLVVWGPDDVQTVARAFVRKCIRGSAVVGAGAFQSTPSPEPGARIGAAWKAFHGNLEHCLSGSGLAEQFAKKFEIGYTRRGLWEHGLNLKFTAENPSVKVYEQLHGLVKKDVPDPVNKLIVFYLQAQKPPSINIKIDPSQDTRKFLAELPDPTGLRRFYEDGQERASEAGRRLSDEVGREAREATTRLGSEAAAAGQATIVAPVQLVGKSAEEAAKKAPEIANTLVPVSTGDGRIDIRPIPAPLPSEASEDNHVSFSKNCTTIGKVKIGAGCKR